MSNILKDEVESKPSMQDSALQSCERSERVETWVKNTQKFHQRSIEESTGIGKRKRSTDSDCLANSDIEEDPDIDDLLLWDKQSSKPKRRIPWSRIPLVLKCEWRNCSFEDSSIENFVKHVSFHIPDAEVKTDDEDNDVLACLWDSCSFESTKDKEYVRHVNFHAYHTKLKFLGQKMMDLLNMPKCYMNPGGHNNLPAFSVEFACEWKDCSRVFNNSQMFFFHVASHLMCYREEMSTKQKKDRFFSCCWAGCHVKCKKLCLLSEHMRSHTQEKLCACPSCGGLFSCSTKLQDHCMNQAQGRDEFRCTSCFKYFACERSLREHMRRHISRYKCSFCDMTCPSPSNLSLHIRYRHLNSKPFKCVFCTFGAKCQRDLDTHLKIHVSEPSFKCSKEGCDFACRTKVTLNNHMRNEHYKSKPIYCCHICNKQFSSGFPLTKHLIDIHNFQWTPGHSRFTYTRNEDGYFRLKPFRLETLDVTQEILQAEIDDHPASISDVCGNQYTVHQLTSSHMNGFLSGVSSSRCHSGKPVVISIDEIDRTGGVVHRKVINTVEVPVEARNGTVVWNYSDEDTSNTRKTEGAMGKIIKIS